MPYLVTVQYTGLYPGHVHLLVHLVNGAFDQPQGQRLHHQQLHLQGKERSTIVKVLSDLSNIILFQGYHSDSRQMKIRKAFPSFI